MASSISVPCPKISSFVKPKQTQKISFALPYCSKSCFSFGSSIKVPAFSGCQWHNEKKTMAFKARAKLKEVAAEKSSNSVPVVDMKSKAALPKEDDKSTGNNIPDVAAISAFMTQVSDLVKKKEAFQPPEQAPPVFMPQYMPHHAMFQTPFPAAAPTAPPAPSNPAPPPLALPSAASPAKTSSSSHPPLKCPMAGTFYRSPAPGEPPFVKVGDKVQKGQVICIIEAMKLMNEIEADQSGTITEILAEDGKPVSVDMEQFEG
ncbi:biotin carboxyl carrier protein of acetyl-CoA carboxylase 2, chloroplastic [Gossypium australe]|uniref:Biotin carboxyl carrier protein of acetyl-CoA carboxylase n=1 Tax=Gossypium australe TaxID=47621 RepID=A0A5B6UHN2_9ROSI|nr:biotin carboxyl carrier protein of acetyl-CoA carboxylase 2, chloroplastic [Gossypium australe]